MVTYFDRMISEGLAPDITSFNFIVDAYGKFSENSQKLIPRPFGGYSKYDSIVHSHLRT
jgi:hypothetical protein